MVKNNNRLSICLELCLQTQEEKHREAERCLEMNLYLSENISKFIWKQTSVRTVTFLNVL